MKVVLLPLAFLLLSSVECYIRDPGPTVIATRGEVWPKPQSQNKSDKYFLIRPQQFVIEYSSGKTCTLLEEAFIRYQNIITRQYGVVQSNLKKFQYQHHKKHWLADDNFLGYLDTVRVELNGTCNDEEYPTDAVDEQYRLNISASGLLTANTIWGILRGLESLSQSVYIGEDLISLRINTTFIYDFPRYPHRGLLVDTARHFIPLSLLLVNLDAMAFNKMNVFHWHIVDDESFPYVSKKFPELSARGAYTPAQIYDTTEVKAVIEYARRRGIRVIPEFDSPGHTRSWGVAFPELLTQCFEDNKATGQLGPVDPTKNFTYEFLAEFFQEVKDTFADEFVHLGGDEVEFECWSSNSNITDFMEKENISSYQDLESYYVQKLINIVDKLQSKIIVWEEVFTNGVVIPNDTVVQVWISPWYETLYKVVASGRKALLSACWYLDHLTSGGDWEDFYTCDPEETSLGSDEQSKRVLGGEACMWAEVVNTYNFISRVWPRTSAVAERLWSDVSVRDIDEAKRRIEEHACRLNARGIDAQPPNGAGFCL